MTRCVTGIFFIWINLCVTLYRILQCQDTMVQFTQFLSQHFSVDEVRHSLPKISDLLQKYNIPAEAAFALIRPVYANTISVSRLFTAAVGIFVVLQARYEEKLKGEVKGKDKDNPSQLMVIFSYLLFRELLVCDVVAVLPLQAYSVTNSSIVTAGAMLP